MARISITSGNINIGQRYLLEGGNITYDTVAYVAGDRFIGTAATTFTVDSGTPIVTEDTVITNFSLTLVQPKDLSFRFPDSTTINSVGLTIKTLKTVNPVLRNVKIPAKTTTPYQDVLGNKIKPRWGRKWSNKTKLTQAELEIALNDEHYLQGDYVTYIGSDGFMSMFGWTLPASISPTGLTGSFLYRTSNTTITNYIAIYAYDAGAALGYLKQNASGTLSLYDTQATAFVEGITLVNNGKWHRLTQCYDRANEKQYLFIDGNFELECGGTTDANTGTNSYRFGTVWAAVRADYCDIQIQNKFISKEYVAGRGMQAPELDNSVNWLTIPLSEGAGSNYHRIWNNVTGGYLNLSDNPIAPIQNFDNRAYTPEVWGTNGGAPFYRNSLKGFNVPNVLTPKTPVSWAFTGDTSYFDTSVEGTIERAGTPGNYNYYGITFDDIWDGRNGTGVGSMLEFTIDAWNGDCFAKIVAHPNQSTNGVFVDGSSSKLWGYNKTGVYSNTDNSFSVGDKVFILFRDVAINYVNASNDTTSGGGFNSTTKESIEISIFIRNIGATARLTNVKLHKGILPADFDIAQAILELQGVKIPSLEDDLTRDALGNTIENPPDVKETLATVANYENWDEAENKIQLNPNNAPELLQIELDDTKLDNLQLARDNFDYSNKNEFTINNKEFYTTVGGVPYVKLDSPLTLGSNHYMYLKFRSFDNSTNYKFMLGQEGNTTIAWGIREAVVDYLRVEVWLSFFNIPIANYNRDGINEILFVQDGTSLTVYLNGYNGGTLSNSQSKAIDILGRWGNMLSTYGSFDIINFTAGLVTPSASDITRIFNSQNIGLFLQTDVCLKFNMDGSKTPLFVKGSNNTGSIVNASLVNVSETPNPWKELT